jgi:predicted TIM-barrel fold metal-dependent hydrolase
MKDFMRIVTLEEHFVVPELVGRIDKEAIAARGWPTASRIPTPVGAGPEALAEVGPERLAAMDKGGITVQVLSTAGPGADLMPPDQGPDLARAYNNRLEEIVDQHFDRFAGFAHLPMTAPEAAADELQRAIEDLGFCGAMINGTTGGRFLDDPSFEPILARAARLDVPLYLHPNLPPQPVREAYYDGLPGPIGAILGTGGWGWHAETAVHIVRLVVSGALDRHPDLKLIIGHMGEGLPAMLGRFKVFDAATSSYLNRTVSRTILDQVWITTSGFFSLPPFMAALMTFGADRILFSVDYPFSPISVATDFLDRLPVSPEDRTKIAHANADRLLKLKVTS